MKVIRLKARAYASEVICGKIPLSDVPQRLRLRNDRYYIFAMRYYQYDRTISNPLEVWKNDIDTLPDGHPDKEWLYDRYLDYKLLNEEQLANKERAQCTEMKGLAYCKCSTFDENILPHDLFEMAQEADGILQNLKEARDSRLNAKANFPMGQLIFGTNNLMKFQSFALNLARLSKKR